MGNVSWQHDLETEADVLFRKIDRYPRLLRFCLDDVPFHDDSFCSDLERMIGAIRDAVCFMKAACEAPGDARAVLKLATLRTRDARVIYSYYVDSVLREYVIALEDLSNAAADEYETAWHLN